MCMYPYMLCACILTCIVHVCLYALYMYAYKHCACMLTCILHVCLHAFCMYDYMHSASMLMSLTPLLSNLAVSTTNTVNLLFNSIKMAEATN